MLEGLQVAVPNELLVAMLCEKTGWTYTDIVSQPQWLIDTLLLKWKVDAEKKE